MLRDAEFVYAAEKPEGTRRLLSACRALGTANVLLGRPQEAIDVFGEALALSSHRPELAHVRLYCLGYMAFAATEIGDRRNAHRWAIEALQLVEEARLDDVAQSAIAYAAGALAQQQRGDHTEAARQLENVRRLRPLLHGVPWLEADCALRCADISLNLGDLAGALEFARVASDALQGYPDAGTLPARLQRSRRADQAREGLRAHSGRAPADRLPADASLAPGDRRSSPPLTPDRQDSSRFDLQQARCQDQVRSRRDRRAVRPRSDRRPAHDPGVRVGDIGHCGR